MPNCPICGNYQGLFHECLPIWQVAFYDPDQKEIECVEIRAETGDEAAKLFVGQSDEDNSEFTDNCYVLVRSPEGDDVVVYEIFGYMEPRYYVYQTDISP